MKIYLDDERQEPEGYIRCRTAREAILALDEALADAIRFTGQTGRNTCFVILCILFLLACMAVGMRGAVVMSTGFESQGTAMVYWGPGLSRPVGTVLPGEWVVPMSTSFSQGYGKNRAILVETEMQRGWLGLEEFRRLQGK